MLAALNRAEEALNMLLAEREAAAQKAPVLCQATTREGKPCKNLALAGQRFCRTHQGKS